MYVQLCINICIYIYVCIHVMLQLKYTKFEINNT